MFIISVYAPTMLANEVEIDSFYGQLSEIVAKVPKRDKLLLLGDFNAKVGQD